MRSILFAGEQVWLFWLYWKTHAGADLVKVGLQLALLDWMDAWAAYVSDW